ncbi:alkane 1-monooxygenase [Celeribacter neptunius]|uniref:Alkane 1-monooxygenase n=1 Tax=Celeribacter neptunius TaxID=588602 RepID=A0A1I3J154_9RHOB|nr:alkane 1-monooxygenase [Celeribacter neptunius]SFI54002.1 alkane 1-monooxygenase [Celeribacter neptunius]
MARKTSHIIRFFAVSTMAPVALLALGALFGGVFALAGFLYMTALAYSLDQLVNLARDPDDPEAEFPDANALSVVLALAHFALLPLGVWALSNGQLAFWERLLVFFGMGLFFGQVSNSNAHELVHRSDRTLRRLGTWVYITLLFGHHATAHVRVHHRYAASATDPNSAPFGMSYYRFLPRAWLGSFKAGLREENAMRARAGSTDLHPYALYIGGAIACLILAFLIGGVTGVIKYVLLAGYASAQLMLSDYVQHYGLRRREISEGKFEPVGPAHSWNSPQWFTSFLMLNAPRHSDHHAHPMKPYVALELTEEMPQLPRSLPAMATLALIPPLWRRVMDKRVERLLAAQQMDGTVGR